MGKRVSTLYIVLSILVFAFVIIWPAVRFSSIRNRNIEASHTAYRKIARKLRVNFEIFGSFASPLFMDSAQSILKHNTPGLVGIIIHSPRNGIEYLLSNQPGLLLDLPEMTGSDNLPPEYSINSLGQIVLSAPMGSSVRTDLTVDAVFSVIDKEQIFPIFRDTLIIAGSFFIITLIFLIVYASEGAPKGQQQPLTDKTSLQSPRIKTGTGKRRKAAPLKHAEQPASKDSAEEGLFSPDSGLGWERLLESRLNFELRRSASFDQDLVLSLIDIREIRKQDLLYKTISQLLIDSFSFQDLLFEFETNGFAVVIPNIDLDLGVQDMEKCMKKIHGMGTGQPLKISVGLSSRNGRLMSGTRLISETKSALLKAKKDKQSSMIVFRPDPVKYREYIASKM